MWKHFYIISASIIVLSCIKGTLEQPINEVLGLSITELISRDGYPIESHQVLTDDGYIVTMFRIKHGKTTNSERPNPRPILIMHGLMGGPENFIVGGIENCSLAYILADNGYDVWLASARGTTHSREHKFLDDQSPEYWQFSWHEIAVYDLAAMIDYILDATKKDKLSYIGHSQGTTVYFVLMSDKPEYNDKILFAAQFTPAVFMSNGPFNYMKKVAMFHRPLWKFVVDWNFYEIFPNIKELGLFVARYLCDERRSSRVLCDILFAVISGFGTDPRNKKILHLLVGSGTQTAGVKQHLHYAQEIDSGHFRHYDFGRTKNEAIYNQSEPPDYNLSNVKAEKIALYYAKNDELISPLEIDRLTQRLPNLAAKYVVPSKKFGHLDFATAVQAVDLVYVPMLKSMEAFYNKS